MNETPLTLLTTTAPIPKARTEEEIRALIFEWVRDPRPWDLEDAPGFEAHRDRLREVRLKLEVERKAVSEEEQNRELDAAAVALGVPGNRVLAGKFMALEARLYRLEIFAGSQGYPGCTL